MEIIIWFWIAFNLFILAMLTLDHREPTVLPIDPAVRSRGAGSGT